MTLYQRWIQKRERTLTMRDPHRRVFPFEWGLEWLGDGGAPEKGDALGTVKDYAQKILQDSGEFFAPPPLQPWRLEDDLLTLETPTPSPYPENNTVYCRLFPAKGARSAVIVIPQWNALEDSHVGLCRVIRRLGITAVRLSMPYHDERRLPNMRRADYMVGSNMGRTLHAIRQAVLEVRQLVVWLKEQGYQRVGVMGTSIGSCIAYLAFVHEPLISAGVFNHVSSHFADVVWTGLSTRYIRWAMEGHISLEDLRDCWAPISPWFYVGLLKERNRPHLLITAKYDLTFRPELSQRVFDQYDSHGIPYQRVVLPCGHYTTATFPFNYLDGWHMCRFLNRRLAASDS